MSQKEKLAAWWQAPASKVETFGAAALFVFAPSASVSKN